MNNAVETFRIKAHDGKLDIYSAYLRHSDGKMIDDKHLCTINNFEGFWPGIDVGYSANCSNCKKNYFNGSTILIKINKHLYIYVNNFIGLYKTKDEIYDYTSYMGNSTVPYPIAFGKEYILP